MIKLPLVNDSATAPCTGCAGPCCVEHDVDVNGFDLVRLSRGLGLPWEALVRDVEQRHPLYLGFRLDGGPTHHHFQLLRRDSGACQFLLELDGGRRRCGVHGLRPGACRAYPLRPDFTDEAGSIIGGHALCPPERRELYRVAREQLRPLVDEDEAEEQLWCRVLHRWDERARRVPPGSPLPMALFVDWLHALYAQLSPMRQSAARGEWQLAAYQAVGQFPLEIPGPSAP